jgi:hypothetical protein
LKSPISRPIIITSLPVPGGTSRIEATRKNRWFRPEPPGAY